MLMQTSSLILCLLNVYSDELRAIRSYPHILSVIGIQSIPATFIENPQRTDASNFLRYSGKLISVYCMEKPAINAKMIPGDLIAFPNERSKEV